MSLYTGHVPPEELARLLDNSIPRVIRLSSPIPDTDHRFVHNLGNRQVIWMLQKDDGGDPGDYVMGNVKPTPGNELNSLDVFCAKAVGLHMIVMG